jgi:hypothetical protein
MKYTYVLKSLLSISFEVVISTKWNEFIEPMLFIQILGWEMQKPIFVLLLPCQSKFSLQTITSTKVGNLYSLHEVHHRHDKREDIEEHEHHQCAESGYDVAVVCNAGFNREPQGLVTRNCHNFI